MNRMNREYHDLEAASVVYSIGPLEKAVYVVVLAMLMAGLVWMGATNQPSPKNSQTTTETPRGE